MTPNLLGRRAARCAVAMGTAAAGLALIAGAAHADTDTAPAPAEDTPVATGVGELTVVAQAVHVSPSAAPLDQTQPTSKIQKEFIANNLIALASYDDIVKFSPSVADQSPNGPGLGKSETLSLRGFQDGQFNVTFDGIPFGDATDFHHTSSALFIAHDIGEAQIDRGPGTASTIGDATFGGSMNFVSKDPLRSLTINPYGTFGSFATYAGGLEVDSGETRLGRGYIDAQDETSNGYLTHAAEERYNVMFKNVVAMNDRLTITVLANYNHAFEYTTQGATLANIKAHGPNFGLGADPTNQNYFGYQPSNYASDFEYVDVKWQATDSWSLDNKVYTDSFLHAYTESKDATDTNPADNKVSFFNAAGAAINPPAGASKTDVPGKLTWAYFRAYGDILRATDELPFGEFQAGLWVDRNDDQRWSEVTDLTIGNLPTGSKSGTPYSYFINDSLTTIQPYVEFDWKPLPNLTITPGVRYTSFIRDYDAPVNKTADAASGLHTPASYSETFSSWQPSIAARYTVMDGWTAYAQVAKGFLAPPINVLEVNSAAAPTVKPEETWNYQVGTAFHHGPWVLGLDAYYIDFSNFITSPPAVNGVTTYVNGGGVIYDGLEFEGQYVLGGGVSFYGNATYNRARYTQNSSVWVAEAPEYTAAAGVLYDNRQGPYASLIAKVIGPRYGLDVPLSGVGLGNSFYFGSYVTADLAAGWRFHGADLPSQIKDFSLSVKVSNLFDNRVIDDYAGQQSATSAAFPNGAPLFWTVPGRSAFVNLSASF